MGLVGPPRTIAHLQHPMRASGKFRRTRIGPPELHGMEPWLVQYGITFIHFRPLQPVLSYF
jgi:hypothetical protein